jgi:thiamine-phosphate pyrophosphorylase
MDAASPRLLLVSPPFDQDGAAEQLSAALAAAGSADIGALLLRGGGLDDAAFARRLDAPLRQAQAAGIAVLLEDRPALLAASGADGLHLTLGEPGGDRSLRLKDLRKRLGDDVILGAGCGASRHLAMTAGEEGADYVGFGAIDGAEADAETLAWWQAVMTPPQVAFGAGDVAAAARLAAAGADFVAAGPAIWAAGGDPAAALSELQRALAQAA